MFLCRFVGHDGEVNGVAWKLAVILFAGFALRLIFALTVRGNRNDYGMFVYMFDRLKLIGLSGYYKGDPSNVLYPVTYFVYLIFGGLSNAMELSSHDLGMQFMIKLPMIIADLLTAFAVYKIAGKYINKATALTLAAFICVCPIFLIGSSIWCTQITFTVMFICFACYYLARKKHALTIAFATLAAFSSKEGIYIFPVVCVFSVYHLVRAAINVKRDKPRGAAVLDSDYRAVITVPVGFVLSFIVTYLIGLFMMHSYSYNPFVYIYEFMIKPLGGWTYFTNDGLSVYSIFNRSGAAPGARFPTWLFLCLFAAIIFAVVFVVYFTKRNRATMVLLMAFSLLTMQVYYPNTTAIGMQSTLAVLVAAYALNRDKRILTVLFVVGLCFAVNSLTVIANMGQLNNLSDYKLSVTALPTSGIKAVTIACSVITLLAHLYFTLVTVSVGMTGQRKMLSPVRGFGASLKEFIAVKKDN